LDTQEFEAVIDRRVIVGAKGGDPFGKLGYPVMERRTPGGDLRLVGTE
jgi:hypothetical protein